jgi:hypothetical protein
MDAVAIIPSVSGEMRPPAIERPPVTAGQAAPLRPRRFHVSAVRPAGSADKHVGPSGRTDPRPSDFLYALAGVGLWIYSRCKYRVVSLGAKDLRLRPGLLLLATHRASGDEPIICGSLYFSSRVWAERRWRIHFTAGDQFFETGFFAGYPSRMPIWARRLLYPIKISGGLSRVGVHSLRSGKRMMLGQALAQLPADMTPAEVIPPPLLDQLHARAVLLGRTPPTRADEFLRGEYADLLWQTVSVEDLSAPGLAQLWQRRKACSRAELSALVDVVQTRQPLLIFPEGRRSPDGRIGPVKRGLGDLINEGRPDTITYIALAYDPLTRGRTRVCAAFTAPQPRPTDDDVRAQALRELRRAMPLTCGQVVAHALLEAANRGQGTLARGALEQRISAAMHAARRTGRPIDPALTDPKVITRRIDECIAAVARRHCVAPNGPDFVLDTVKIGADEIIVRLAREYTSARDLMLTSAPHITAPASH